MDEGTADIGKEGWSKVIFKPLNSHYECLRLYETIARSISWMEEGIKVSVKPHKIHQGVFFAKGKEDVLCTKNIFPGEAVNNEKIFSVENEDGTKVEYSVWNPFCSMLAAAILAEVKDIHIKPGARVLYLGAGSGTTVSHVSDIVGTNGLVYAVESSLTSGRDLVNMAKKRTNVIPIIQDAKFPARYAMLVGKVDVMCSEFAEPDGASILALNALYFLRDGGSFVMSLKESCGVSRDHEHAVLWATSKLRPKMNLSLWSILGVHDSCTFGYYGRNPKEEY